MFLGWIAVGLGSLVMAGWPVHATAPDEISWEMHVLPASTPAGGYWCVNTGRLQQDVIQLHDMAGFLVLEVGRVGAQLPAKMSAMLEVEPGTAWRVTLTGTNNKFLMILDDDTLIEELRNGVRARFVTNQITLDFPITSFDDALREVATYHHDPTAFEQRLTGD